MPVFTSIAVSPSGSTLLNALAVTTSAGTVFNEVVTIGDPANPANYASVSAGALLVTGNDTIVGPLGQTTMAASIPVVLASNQSAGAFPATQTVAGTVAITSSSTQTITAVQATAASFLATVIGTVTAAQTTAASLNATVVGTVTANAGTGTLAVSAASLPTALGMGTLSYGQVVITTSATQIIAASATRKYLTLSLLNNGPNLYLGDASVATNTGLLLLGIQGASISVPTTAALYGIAQGTTTSNAVSFLEGHA